MNYSAFFEDLKAYLIAHNLQSKDDFDLVNVSQINQFELDYNIELPVAYKDYLKLFGGIYLLLGFYSSSYSFEALVEANANFEDDKTYYIINNTDAIKRSITAQLEDLILIDSFEGHFCTYISKDDNPFVYTIGYNSPYKTVLRKHQRFTTYIKDRIRIHIMNLYADRNFKRFDQLWSQLLDIKIPKATTDLYDAFLNKIEHIEIATHRIYTLTEQERLLVELIKTNELKKWVNLSI